MASFFILYQEDKSKHFLLGRHSTFTNTKTGLGEIRAFIQQTFFQLLATFTETN